MKKEKESVWNDFFFSKLSIYFYAKVNSTTVAAEAWLLHSALCKYLLIAGWLFKEDIFIAALTLLNVSYLLPQCGMSHLREIAEFKW